MSEARLSVICPLFSATRIGNNPRERSLRTLYGTGLWVSAEYCIYGFRRVTWIQKYTKHK